MPKNYRFICVLDSVAKQGFSSLDASPDYLHIHILESDCLPKIEDFAATVSGSKSHDHLIQWGTPLQLAAKTRSSKVDSKTIKQFGQVGLGSAALGNELEENFEGGGEAFLFGDTNVRITKGNEVFNVDEDGAYWTFQVADFQNAEKISSVIGQKVDGRDSLKDMLLQMSDGQPFIATFDADFDGFARSNGLFSKDELLPQNPKNNLFEKGLAKGGHVVGGSNNLGDLKTIEENSLDPDKSDFSLTFTSNILIKKIELKIVEDNNSLRSPRTQVEVVKAFKVVEKFCLKS